MHRSSNGAKVEGSQKPKAMPHTRQESVQTLPSLQRGESKASLRQMVRHTTSAFGGTGRVGTLTPQQAATLAQFRQAIEKEKLLASDDSLGIDDATLLRFLRARSFQMPKSLEMVRAAQEWRHHVCDVGMDKLYEEVIDPFDYPQREEVFKYWPLYFHGVSKAGLPINIQSFGKIDLKALYHHVDKDYHWRAVVANCEALPRECMPACSEAAGRPVEGAFCVVDLKGFSIFQFWGFKPMAQRLFQISQDFFPETMGKVLVINSPTGFATIWKAIKPWLAPQTVAKINILGSNYQTELFNLCDRDQLPKTFGGTCECGNGGCMLNSPGPWKDARAKLGVERARKGPNRSQKAVPHAIDVEMGDQSAHEAHKAMNGSADPAEDHSTGALAAAKSQASDPAKSQEVGETPKIEMANGDATDPRTIPAPGQGQAIKRVTSHGVERVLVEADANQATPNEAAAS